MEGDTEDSTFRDSKNWKVGLKCKKKQKKSVQKKKLIDT